MKTSNLFLAITVMLIVLSFTVGCERKVINEAGDDQTSLNSCFTCHGDDDFDLIAARTEYSKSLHATGETYNRNRLNSSRYSSCEKCHTNEGFVAEVTDVDAAGDHFTNISCFTCHAPHSNGSLELRTIAAVALGNNAIYDRGYSNLCAECHQSRRDVGTYVADDVELSEHYGPHHSNQSDMLIGENAYEYAGYTYENSYHSYGLTEGCLSCHMSSGIYNTGGHSFNMEGEDEGEDHYNVIGCNDALCHNGNMEDFNRISGIDFDWDGELEGIQDEIEGLLDSLAILLDDAGVYDIDAGHPIEDVVVPDEEITGALYNLMFVMEDQSKGIHNTDYAVGLLRSSINYIVHDDPTGAGKMPVLRSSNWQTLAAH